MEFFNFENNFEIEVNHPQAEVFTKFEAYVSKKTWKIIHSDHKEFISFQTRTALIAITFIANNDNSTTLSITTKTEQFDYNRNLGIIHKILKECLSEQIDNVEEEHNEVQYSNSKPKQKKKQRRRKTYDNDSKRKVIFVATIALFAIVCLYPSVSSYIKEHWNSPNIEYAYENETYDEKKSTDEPQMEVYLERETVIVKTAGAGFRYAEACVCVNYRQTKGVNARVKAYAYGEVVGSAIVTIEAGKLQGSQSFRLDGFMGMFEERIPPTVTLEITSVTKSIW